MNVRLFYDEKQNKDSFFKEFPGDRPRWYGINAKDYLKGLRVGDKVSIEERIDSKVGFNQIIAIDNVLAIVKAEDNDFYRRFIESNRHVGAKKIHTGVYILLEPGVVPVIPIALRPFIDDGTIESLTSAGLRKIDDAALKKVVGRTLFLDRKDVKNI